MIDLTVYDVGRGLSVLVVLPPRHPGYVSIGIVDCFAASGKREPMLGDIERRFGRRVSIEFLVLSHMHSDHFLGVGTLLDRFGSRIRVIADSGVDIPHIIAREYPSDAIYDATARGDLLKLHAFKKRHRAKVRALTGPVIELYADRKNDVVVRSVAPPSYMLDSVSAHLRSVVQRLRRSSQPETGSVRPQFDLNRTSSAVEIVHQGRRIVVGGDVLQSAWTSVRAQVADLRSDVFVLSHHGASNGFPRHWAKWISKSTQAIVSGEGYNQPSPHVVKSIKSSGGRVWATTLPGTTPRVRTLADYALAFHHGWPEAGPRRGDVRCVVNGSVSLTGLEY